MSGNRKVTGGRIVFCDKRSQRDSLIVVKIPTRCHKGVRHEQVMRLMADARRQKISVALRTSRVLFRLEMALRWLRLVQVMNEQ